jgi:predicted Zn-ribbon and HTH transcriptional regulator
MLWFACTVIVLLSGIYILKPLFEESKGSLDIELLAETELDRLFDRKAVIYGNLKDLEFEYKMGRLSDTDFRQLEAGYKNEAADILQSLDRLSASENLDEAIEKDIASRKARLYASNSKRIDNSSRCPSCGAEIISGKKYCADCGHRL